MTELTPIQPALRADWALGEPPLAEAYAEAVIDVCGEWLWLGWRTQDGNEHGEIAWPFVGEWADAQDLELLGFQVVCL